MYHTGLSFENGQTFRRGIRTLREVVQAGRDRDKWLSTAHLPPELREPVQIRLDAPFTEGAHIFVRLNTSNLYISSVHNNRAGFYFDGDAPTILTKTMEDQVILGFTGRYNDLGRFASLGKISQGTIDGAIAAISGWERTTEITSTRKTADGKNVQSDQSRQLLTLCLLVAESARFYKVAESVENMLDGNHAKALPLGEIDTLVRKWEQKSREKDSGAVAVYAEVQKDT